jgi:hypothetical protein
MLLLYDFNADNLYSKQVIKQLNIGNLQRDVSSTHKQDVPSNKGDTGIEVLHKLTCTLFNIGFITLTFFCTFCLKNMLHDSIDDGENGSNRSDKELGTQRSEAKEGKHVSANFDDDLDVFDWY